MNDLVLHVPFAPLPSMYSSFAISAMVANMMIASSPGRISTKYFVSKVKKIFSSPPHHLTTSPPHHLTTSSPHHLTTSPPHHLTSSPPHLLTSSPPHLRDASRIFAHKLCRSHACIGGGKVREVPQSRLYNCYFWQPLDLEFRVTIFKADLCDR